MSTLPELCHETRTPSHILPADGVFGFPAREYDREEIRTEYADEMIEAESPVTTAFSDRVAAIEIELGGELYGDL